MGVLYGERQLGLRDMSLALEWSRLYKGKTVLDFMSDRPNTTVKDLKSVVLNEGGWIDDDLVIHHRDELR